MSIFRGPCVGEGEGVGAGICGTILYTVCGTWYVRCMLQWSQCSLCVSIYVCLICDEHVAYMIYGMC